MSVKRPRASRGLVGQVRDRRRRTATQRAERLHGRSQQHDGSPRTAVNLLERAIDAHPGTVPVAWLRQAPALHQAANSEVDLVDRAFERALLRSPHHGPLAKAYAASLRQRDPSVAIDRLIGLLDRSPRPLPGVLLQLLGGRDDAQVRPRVEAWLREWEGTVGALAIARVWQAWGALEEPSPADVQTVADLPAAAVRLFFIGRPPLRVGLTEAIERDLTGSAESLRWFADDFLTPDDPPDWPPRQWPSEPAKARHQEVRDPRLGFQTRLIRDGRLLLRDPGTNREVTPFDSTIVVNRVVYSFGDRRLFALLTGGYGGMASFVYDAQRHQLIDLGADLPWHMTVERVGTMLAHLMLRAVVRLPAEHAAAISRRHDTRPRHVVMHVSVVENPAHHLSNTFPGIERVVDHGLADRVAEIFTVRRSEFYGTFTELFSEFEAVPVVEVEPQIDLDPHPYSHDHVLVMPGGYFIRHALIERVVEHLTAMPSDPHGIEPPTPAPFPLVWLGIRMGTRSWVDQESGLHAVIEQVREQWPEALFVVDGFSRPMGRDLASDQWRSTIDAMSDLGSRLGAAFPAGTVLNLVGNRLRENVLWARTADVYLTPSGSSQHKVGWLSDAPGVIYGSEKVVILPPERRIGSTESEATTIPVAVVGTIASRGELWSNNDARTNTENVSLDPDQVAGALLALIGSVAKRRR